MSARPSSDSSPRPWHIAIVGNDMLLAALPGRAIQLAHAILAAGYDLVVPVSWGEELLAEHVLRELENAPSHAMVFCACPLVRQRLLVAGNEIVPHLLSTVAPPVATARYLRALQPDVAMHITYLGACAGAAHDAIDVQRTPQEFLQHLQQRGIAIAHQPLVFEAMVPPDRRRHWSVPGGAPSPEALAARGLATRFVTVGAEVALEIADAILSAERVLLDVAPTQGCACAGAVEVHAVEGNREAVIALEPPRSPLPVIDVEPRVPVANPLPHLTGHGVSRTMRSPVLPRPTPTPVTPILDAARTRAERRRIAITPPHVGATEPRARHGAPSRLPGPAQGASRRAEAPEHPRKSPALPLLASRSEGATAPPLPPPPPPPTPTDVETSHGSSGAAPERAHAEAEPEESPAPTVVRRRTPTYEMRHVARTRSAHAEPPRVPRAYGAVRSRMRLAEPSAAGDASEDLSAAIDGATPSHPTASITGAEPLQRSVTDPVSVDPPVVSAQHAPATPTFRPAATPRLERRGDRATRSHGWIIGLLAALATAGVLYVVLGR